jgi:hypothetical protein
VTRSYIQRRNENSELQRSCGLAEGNRSRKNRLSIDAESPVGREVWIGCANAAFSGIDTIERCRGRARHTTGEFIQFISHAEGSVAELDTQLTLSVALGFCDGSDAGAAFELVNELRRMLNALRRKLSTRG